MDQSTDFYGYLPSKPAALFGIVYFGAATIASTLQMIIGRYPHYWMATIALAGVGEALGWGARLWAHIEVGQVQGRFSYGKDTDSTPARQLDAIHDPDLQFRNHSSSHFRCGLCPFL